MKLRRTHVTDTDEGRGGGASLTHHIEITHRYLAYISAVDVRGERIAHQFTHAIKGSAVARHWHANQPN